LQRFLIEVTHEAELVACAVAVRTLLASGSHFLTHADFGCADGDHKAWLIVEVDNRDQALQIVPPALRPQTRIVGLNRFTLAEIDTLLAKHAASASADLAATAGEA
jgi:hypothetical protein